MSEWTLVFHKYGVDVLEGNCLHLETELKAADPEHNDKYVLVTAREQDQATKTG